MYKMLDKYSKIGMIRVKGGTLTNKEQNGVSSVEEIDVLRKILTGRKCVTLKPNSIIVHEGKACTRLFYLVRGKVAAFVPGGSEFVCENTQSAFRAQIELIDEESRWIGSIRTIEESTIAVVQVKDLFLGFTLANKQRDAFAERARETKEVNEENDSLRSVLSDFIRSFVVGSLDTGDALRWQEIYNDSEYRSSLRRIHKLEEQTKATAKHEAGLQHELRKLREKINQLESDNAAETEFYDRVCEQRGIEINALRDQRKAYLDRIRTIERLIPSAPIVRNQRNDDESEENTYVGIPPVRPSDKLASRAGVKQTTVLGRRQTTQRFIPVEEGTSKENEIEVDVDDDEVDKHPNRKTFLGV
jgi:FtsZ-binding cell division protein ZapB